MTGTPSHQATRPFMETSECYVVVKPTSSCRLGSVGTDGLQPPQVIRYSPKP